MTAGKKKQKKSKILQTPHGEIKAPFFMPIATKGAVKSLNPEELRNLGAQIVLGNTYHLWLRPGNDLIKKAGGLHKFMNWPGPILTDSGGFQVFSLGDRQRKNIKEGNKRSKVKLSEEGVEFSDPIDGSKHFLTPEKSIQVQLDLGSDIIMCLDECPGYPCSHDYAKKSLELTTRWAERCKKYFDQKTKKLPKEKRPLLFGIIQGSIYKDLREESARQILNIDLDGYAIGGVAVGEPRKHFWEVLKWVLPLLPEDKPRYLMGLGRPEEIVKAVKLGVDMFDCVIPTREGRHGRLFLRKNNFEFLISNFQTPPQADQSLAEISNNKDLFYSTININNEKYREDFLPVDPLCDCPLCRNYSRAYLRHLFAVKEPLALRLGTLHNLKFYLDLMKALEP